MFEYTEEKQNILTGREIVNLPIVGKKREKEGLRKYRQKCFLFIDFFFTKLLTIST